MITKIGIIGQGFVGTAVYEGMKNYFEVYTFSLTRNIKKETIWSLF